MPHQLRITDIKKISKSHNIRSLYYQNILGPISMNFTQTISSNSSPNWVILSAFTNVSNLASAFYPNGVYTPTDKYNFVFGVTNTTAYSGVELNPAHNQTAPFCNYTFYSNYNSPQPAPCTGYVIYWGIKPIKINVNVCITNINMSNITKYAWNIGVFVNDQLVLDNIDCTGTENIIVLENGDNFNVAIQNNSDGDLTFSGSITYSILAD